MVIVAIVRGREKVQGQSEPERRPQTELLKLPQLFYLTPTCRKPPSLPTSISYLPVSFRLAP